MKLIDTKPENFNPNYIYFNEPIQNTIINESRFIRILYSTPNIIFNGINILLKINIDGVDKQYNKNIIYYSVDKNYENIHTLDDLSLSLLKKIEHFFRHYKDNEPNKFVIVDNFKSRDIALEILKAASRGTSCQSASGLRQLC
jgi:hypothetical protein